MNNFRKAQLIVLVFVASAALRAQAGSPSNALAGESKAGRYLLNRVRVSGGVAERNLIRKIVPKYPEYAKENRIQGTVVLHAIIDKQGNVAELHTLSGHPSLAPTALEAVRQWRYRPYLLNGEAVEVETTITVNFNLVPMEHSRLPAQRSGLPIPESLQAPLSR
jgi:TonB family protein